MSAHSHLQQPTPFQSAQSPQTPNVEWLEQSAETMSLHSRTSQSKKRTDSRRSSLRSKSRRNSSPPRSYPGAFEPDTAIAEGSEMPGWHGGRTHVPPVPSVPQNARDWQGDNSHIYSQGIGPYAGHNGQYDFQQQVDSPRASTEYTSEEQHMLQAPYGYSYVSREPSNATGSTMKHAGSIFRDFDGTHYTAVSSGPPDGYVVPAEEHLETVEMNSFKDSEVSHDNALIEELRLAYDQAARDAESRQEESNNAEEGQPPVERVDILPAQPHNLQLAQPPPAEGMVYYPAPVPLKLNRPQRLSQHPAATIGGQRRSQALSSMAPNLTRSTVELSEGNEEDKQTEYDVETGEPANDHTKQRQKVLNMQKLPPQLRATVFFDQQSVPHKVKVKQGSAVATLDSLLDASARAPADATVDDTVRAAFADLKQQKTKSRASSLFLGSKEDAGKSRLSLLPFRKVSSDKVSQLKKRASSALGLETQGHDIIYEDEDYDSEDEYNETTPLADQDSVGSYGFENGSQDGDEVEADVELEEGKDVQAQIDQEYNGAPTTLLAELQLRKQELKSRNRTAATAFPNGMHSTLLEMDAVAQIEKKKRQTRRTTLAWEDPTETAAAKVKADDDDVPLAILYPTKDGLVNKAGGADWDRPLGLLAKRDMEETEPLSKRRNRLKGIKPEDAKPPPSATEAEQDEDGSEHEGETLAQRTRRLKSAKALNDAIGGGGKEKQPGDDFTAQVLSQFGGVSEAAKVDAGGTTQEPPAEEETLGQRRKRLQAEAKSRAASNGLANLLAENPIRSIRQASNGPATSGLVGQSEHNRQQRQTILSQQNQMSSPNLLDGPLARSNKPSHRTAQVGGLLGASAETSEARRQQIYATNQYSSSVGLGASLVEAQGMVGQQRQTSVRQNSQRQRSDPLQALRQSKNSMYDRYNDGSSNVAASHVSGFPHMQAQSSLQTRGFASSGFGISPAVNPMHNAPYNGQRVQSLQRPSMPSLSAPAPQPQLDPALEALSPKQRENIDRWRQSIME